MEHKPASLDAERLVEFEFIRATENAALNVVHWLGRGDKEAADAAACDAIRGVFDLLDVGGEVVIGEGIKDNAPGIFRGEKLGHWGEGVPRFEIALDPVDGTTNVASGMPNAISVIAATQLREGQGASMQNLPSFYSEKLAYGPRVVEAIARGLPAISLDDPLSVTLRRVADALGKRVPELVVCVLNRHRHAEIIREIRSAGAALRMITDGDITAAVAPSLPDSGVDMFCGIGGSPEAILTATALKALQGDMLVRLWPRDDAERSEIEQAEGPDILRKVWRASDLVRGESGIFCATGISDSPLLPGVRLYGKKAETHSLLMRARSRTVRYIRAVHDLEHKTIFLRSSAGEQKL